MRLYCIELKLGGELTYKHIEMNAEALVENMKVTLPWRDENGDYLIQYFTDKPNYDDKRYSRTSGIRVLFFSVSTT